MRPADTFTAHDVEQWLSTKEVDKGRAYIPDVSQLRIGDTDIRANVQGTATKPYRVLIQLDTDNPHGYPRKLNCSCPVGSACKHTAATLLAVLEQREQPQPEPAAPSGGGWMDALRLLSGAPAAAPTPEKRGFRLLWQLSEGAAGDFRLSCFKGRFAASTRPTGALSPWMNFEQAVNTPPQFMDEDDLFAIRLLLAQNKRPRGVRSDLSVIGPHGGDVLLRLAATGRLYAGPRPLTPLESGVPRSSRIVWNQDDTNHFHAGAVCEPPPGWVIPVTPPLYADTALGEVGQLQFDIAPATVARILSMPPMSEAEARLAATVLAEAAPGIEPPPLRPARELVAPMEAVLSLDTVRIPLLHHLYDYPSLQVNVQLDFARLQFRYDGALLPRDPAQVFARLPDGEMVRVQRDVAAEAAALELVGSLGLKPIPAGSLHLSQPAEFDPNTALVLGNEQAWADFMVTAIPRLQDEDEWEVLIPAQFRHHALAVDAWEADFDEDAAGWFNFNMGVVVEGRRLPLAPLLADLFQRDNRWLEALELAHIDDAENVHLVTPEGQRIRVPAARLKPLARTLIDLFIGRGNPSDIASGKLRLSRLDAPRLAALAGPGWNTQGLDAVQRAAEKLAALADAKGVEPVAPPEGFALELRPYQLEGLAWLQYLREHDLAGILADDMGLGKTAQALAHLLLEKQAGRLGPCERRRKNGPLPALVVLPTSLLFNWKAEAARFAPQLSLLSLHGKERVDHFAEIPNHDVVLTTYPLLWRDAEILNRYEYHLLLLDEAQTVKNSASQGAAVIRALRARHRVCLTGTPLENHLGELWSQFDFLLPGFLGDAKNFSRTWRTPIEKHGDTLRRDLLARRIRPFVLRRRKEDVAKELPPKNIIVRTVELAGGQRDLYETVRAAMDARVRQEIAAHGFARSHIVILDALLKLRQVCCDPRLVQTPTAQRVQERAKLDMLMTMLPELVDEGRRILLFSQFTSMLALIEAELNAIGLKYVILTGSTKDRETPIREFQDGQVPIFLISLKAGGVGLNLTAADTVIHYDPWWNPAVENQATDRAHRIGQTKHVFVYKLVAAGSIEEKILALQEQKSQLAAGILSDDKSGDTKFSEADLSALLAPLPVSR
ncbi:MAG TPA: DEAD/DEAH box helicase [Rhodocyclaceae bacterium]|nr:DEAD/DEAH box helicase [Rhodocyclaceae bacterium]